MAETKADFYYKVYNQQGGDFPVFQGARYVQYGSGFGDILRGIFRNILPVVARGAATFLGGLVENRDQGANWSTAAKSALLPTAQAMMAQTSNQLAQSQQGSGIDRVEDTKTLLGGSKVYKGKNRKGKKRKLSFKQVPVKLPKYNF